MFTNDFYSVRRLMHHELDDRPYDRDQRVLEDIQKVTVAEVHRVAKAYLTPQNMTLCVFGALTEEDEKALESKYNFTLLPKEEVFSGGY